MGSSFPSRCGPWLRVIHPEPSEGTFGAQLGCEIRMGGKAMLSNSHARASPRYFLDFLDFLDFFLCILSFASHIFVLSLQLSYLYGQLEQENHANVAVWKYRGGFTYIAE